MLAGRGQKKPSNPPGLRKNMLEEEREMIYGEDDNISESCQRGEPFMKGSKAGHGTFQEWGPKILE